MKQTLRLRGGLCPKPKPIIYYFYTIFLTFTVLLVSCVCSRAQVSASSPEAGPAAGAVEAIKPLKIGDTIPDALWNLPLQMVKAGQEGSTTVTLNDYKGKLIILDFWATWCGACIGMMPKMDSLQKEFGDKVQFLSVTYQKAEKALPFLEKLEKQHGKKYGVPVAVQDVVLKSLFPHRILPHYVWIGEDGNVKAITGMEAINSGNLRKLLNNKKINAKEKKDVRVSYDYSEPLFLDGGKSNVLLTHSIITSYIDSLGAMLFHSINNPKKDILKRITITNFSMVRLYQVALGKGTRKFNWNRTVLDVDDPTTLRCRSSGTKYREWLDQGNGFCYELIPPKNCKDPFALMEQDLIRFFPDYKVSIEKRKTSVLVLKRTSAIDMLKTAGGAPLSKIDATGCTIRNAGLAKLNSFIDYYMKPVIDETGYTGKIDLKIDADMGNLDAINEELARYNLKYVDSQRSLDFLVVRNNLEYKHGH